MKFTTTEEIKFYTQQRFPPDTAPSGMDEGEKSHHNVYQMASHATLAQCKDMLAGQIEHVSLSATRKKIYQFFLDRIKEVQRIDISERCIITRSKNDVTIYFDGRSLDIENPSIWELEGIVDALSDAAEEQEHANNARSLK